MTAPGTSAGSATRAGVGDIILEAKGISKVFPGVRALDSVDFTLRGGEVHALVGENGAGKSTLMKMISGIYHPDEGEIFLRGEKIELPNPLAAHHAGISVIHQEFHLMNHLTAAQNIFIGRESKSGGAFINDAEMNRKAKESSSVLASTSIPGSRWAA